MEGLPPSLTQLISGFSAAPRQQAPKKCGSWAWLSQAACDGLLPQVTEPLPAAAVASLLSEGVAIVDGVLGLALARHALDDAEAAFASGRLRPAAVGRLQLVDTDVRGDSSTFLDDSSDDYDGGGLARVGVRLRLARAQLSRLGLVDSNRVSTQLACYATPGARYARHRDVDPAQFNGTDEPRRRFTAIYYLNERWSGGELRLDGGPDVEPKIDRLVVFRSETEHEVLPSYEKRWAVTQWWYATPRACLVDVPALLSSEGGPTIFVSVASYRDPDTKATVQDALAKARRPGRVRIGIVAQYDVVGGSDDKHFVGLECGVVDMRDAAGPCPARALAMARLYDDEDFFLQIDSHTRFSQDWDDGLLDAWRRCPSQNAVLTAYPPDLDQQDDLRPTLLAPSHFDDDGALRIVGRRLANACVDPVPSPLWCAGFSFAPRAAVKAAPYDPHLRFLFFGEEIAMAARLWTHGFDFFAPPRPFLYHRWSRSGRPNFREDAQTFHPHAQRRLRARSLRRIKALLGMDRPNDDQDIGPEFDKYRLGAVRLLGDFEARVGINLATCRVYEGARNAGLPDDAFAAPVARAAASLPPPAAKLLADLLGPSSPSSSSSSSGHARTTSPTAAASTTPR